MDAAVFGSFPAKDLDRIRDAAAAAERGTSGEIVTVIADATDDYMEALWRGGAVGATLGLALVALLGWAGRDWGFDPLLHLALPVVIGTVAGVAMVWALPPLRRLFAGREVMATRVCDAAEAAFLEEAVFETVERSGVLLFVTLFERQAVVLADEGVHAAVPEGVWDEVVEGVGYAMRRGEPVRGLLTAIESCGRILRDHDLKAGPDDIDELSDLPRLRPS